MMKMGVGCFYLLMGRVTHSPPTCRPDRSRVHSSKISFDQLTKTACISQASPRGACPGTRSA